LHQAAGTADKLSDLLARATTDRADNNSSRVMRDKAYTHLKQAVDQVRECGQYVFWRNEARLKGYASHYHRRTRRSSKDSSADAAGEDT